MWTENLRFLKQKLRHQAEVINSNYVYLQTIKCIDVLLYFRILFTVTDFRNIFKKSACKYSSNLVCIRFENGTMTKF